MKRRINALRDVLLHVESSDQSVELTQSGSPEGYHHALVLADGGYLRSTDISSLSSYEVSIERMTDKGHDLLDRLRNLENLTYAKAAALRYGFDPDDLEIVMRILAHQRLSQVDALVTGTLADITSATPPED